MKSYHDSWLFIIIVITGLGMSGCAATMATSPAPTAPPASAEPELSAWAGSWKMITSSVMGRNVSYVIENVSGVGASVTYTCSRMLSDPPGACERPQTFYARFREGKLVSGYLTLTLDGDYLYAKWDGPGYVTGFWKLTKDK